MAKPQLIIVCPATGDRLCQDMKWRSHACFGTYPECVKLYRYPKAAHKAAWRYQHPHNTGFYSKQTKVIVVNDGDEVDAAGRIKRKGETEWAQM